MSIDLWYAWEGVLGVGRLEMFLELERSGEAVGESVKKRGRPNR